MMGTINETDWPYVRQMIGEAVLRERELMTVRMVCVLRADGVKEVLPILNIYQEIGTGTVVLVGQPL